MKNVLKLNKLLFLLTFSFFIISCDNDDAQTLPEELTIVETAAATPELSILVEALTAADGDLVTTLSGGNFTVLAPTNDAFAGFLSANGFASLDEVPTDVLSNILLNHVITGSVMSTDLASAGSGYTTTNATNMDGDNLSLYFNTSSGVEFNGQSSVVLADI
nr:fasciclin domain-containing protein [Flavobacteriales bacterium]